MISYKDILKEENKNLKYLFPFSIKQREKAYKNFFYKNYKELNKERMLP
jgi:hypothetical protein